MTLSQRLELAFWFLQGIAWGAMAMAVVAKQSPSSMAFVPISALMAGIAVLVVEMALKWHRIGPPHRG